VTTLTKFKFFPFLIFFCLCFSAKAQKLNIKNYSIEDGLPQSQILDIAQDHSRLLWLSTNSGGVSYFDGQKFVSFTTKEGLNSNHVYTVFEDKNKTIWIGTSKGLNKYTNSSLKSIDDSIINSLNIYYISEQKNGELWLGTNNGIYIYNGKIFRASKFNTSIANTQVCCIKQDLNGNTWIATMFNGLYCYDGKRISHYGTTEGLTDLKVHDILISDSKIWIATYHGINILDLSSLNIGWLKFDTLKISGKPYMESTYKLYKDSTGTIWVGNTTGVYKIFHNKLKKITRNNGLCNSVIDAITMDKEGNMWFGSFGGGLSKYINDEFISINEQHGLTNNSVTSFLKDEQDNIWIGTARGGVSKLDYKKWKEKDTAVFETFLQQKNGLCSNSITAICQDVLGKIWFASSTSGVSVFDGKKFKNYDIRNGLDGLRIQAIASDRNGNVWIAHENGLTKFDGEKFSYFGKDKGVSAYGVSTIYIDDAGILWFGAQDKIIKYDGKSFGTLTRSEGFPHIRNIIKDKHGFLWVSTDAGACVYNGKIFRNISENDGLISNNIAFIKTGDDGNIWIGTNKGIEKLDLDKFINQKEVAIKHIGKNEGFTAGGCNPDAFLKDDDGKLWIGTESGIFIYDSKESRKNNIEPNTFITGLRLFLAKADFKQYSDSIVNGLPVNLKLPYDKNHLTFDFIGISLSNPEKTRYQYKLEGADADWSPIVKENLATYSILAPGKYTFMVKACNGDEIWNTKPYTFSFEIVPPYWKRAWFYVAIMSIGLIIIYTLVKMRERRLRYAKKLLERQVLNRTKELEEEKEKLEIAYQDIDDKNKSITDSIRYAKRLQRALLPTDAAMKQLFPQSFVLFKPKDIVSGDFYWVEQWGHHTLLAAVDCTGHGVPGAFMSIVGHNILSQSVNVLGLSKPALILNETNKQLSRKLNQNPEEVTVRDGMDISLISINYTKAVIEFAGANKPVWIIRNDEVIEIKGNKFPIGAYVGEELQKFTNHEWELQKGDYIYLFTDGYADQFGGPLGKKFKYKQLQQLLLEHHKKPLIEQRNILEKTFEEWRGNLDQVDDVLVIGIRV
jgi:ligand-binding sensor domain-containing protein/serine phosphatase RsbU (regulator of sigma subunit)